MNLIPKYLSPNISRSDLISSSPCMVVDSKDFPHVSWFESAEGHYKVLYKFWDGISWAYRNSPIIDTSNKEIVGSQYSMMVELNKPILAYGILKSTGNHVVVKASPVGSTWNKTEMNLGYVAQWIGILPYTSSHGVSSSSFSMSSSSSSGGDTPSYRLIITYDVNNVLRIYRESSSLELIGQITEEILNVNSIHIGVSYGNVCLCCGQVH